MMDPAVAISQLQAQRARLAAIPSANPAQEAEKQALLRSIDARIATCQQDLALRQAYHANKARIATLEQDVAKAAAATEQRDAFIRDLKQRYSERPLKMSHLGPADRRTLHQLNTAARESNAGLAAQTNELQSLKQQQSAIQSQYAALKQAASAANGMADTPTDSICQPCVADAVSAFAAKQARQAGGDRVWPGAQNYGNCGIQSAGQMISAKSGKPVDEDALLEESIAKNDAEDVWFGRLRRKYLGQKQPTAGGTNYATRANIMKRHGVETEDVEMTRANLGDAIRQNKGVIAAVDAGVLWNDTEAVGGGHAVFVYDGDFDANGNLTHVYINDTGANDKGRKMTADEFFKAAEARGSPGNRFNVSKDPLW